MKLIVTRLSDNLLDSPLHRSNDVIARAPFPQKPEPVHERAHQVGNQVRPGGGLACHLAARDWPVSKRLHTGLKDWRFV